MSRFDRAAAAVSHALGKPKAAATALAVVLAWALSGPLFGFSDTWQLVINTGTTVVTFLMIFVVQNTQNRDTEAMEKKLDELIRSNERARNSLIGIEKPEEERPVPENGSDSGSPPG